MKTELTIDIFIKQLRKHKIIFQGGVIYEFIRKSYIIDDILYCHNKPIGKVEGEIIYPLMNIEIF